MDDLHQAEIAALADTTDDVATMRKIHRYSLARLADLKSRKGQTVGSIFAAWGAEDVVIDDEMIAAA